MNCKEAIRLVCEYLEGRLSPSVAFAIRRHISDCKNCRMVMDAAKQTLEVYFDQAAAPAEARKPHAA